MGRFIRFLTTGRPAGALLVLAAAAVACGSPHDEGGNATSAEEIFPACPEPTFEALSLPEPLSGIEWREACAQAGKPVFRTRQLLGLSCSESGCASAIQALDAARAQAVVATPGGVRLTCRSYVVAMRENQVVATADSVSELPGLVGPLDTPAEAAFAVAFYGVACEGLRSASNGFEVLSVEEQDSCPIQAREVTYALSSDAAFARIQTGAWESTGTCH